MIYFCLSIAYEIVTFWLQNTKFAADEFSPLYPLPADTADVNPDDCVQLPHLMLQLAQSLSSFINFFCTLIVTRLLLPK